MIYRASFALMLGKKDLIARFMSLAMKSRTIHKKRNPKQKIDYPNSYLVAPELNPNLKTINYCARDALMKGSMRQNPPPESIRSKIEEPPNSKILDSCLKIEEPSDQNRRTLGSHRNKNQDRRENGLNRTKNLRHEGEEGKEEASVTEENHTLLTLSSITPPLSQSRR
jgi:hypothetical protein